MEPRTRRTYSDIIQKASVIDGRIRWRMSPLPMTGRSLSLMPKRYISRKPTQKLGMLTPKKEMRRSR